MRPFMSRLNAAAAALFLFASTVSTAGAPAKKPAVDAAALHASAIIVDGHADTPQLMLDLDLDLTVEGDAHVTLPKAIAGNLGGEFFSIWVDPDTNPTHPGRRALDLIDAVRLQVERHPEELTLALTANDIVAARTGKKKKLAVLMGVEGGHALEADIRMLRIFHRLGVRYLTLTWSNTNELGDASGDIEDAKVKHHGGLTAFGKQVVAEMNRLGMLVDVSHVSDQTFFDTLKVTQAPVIASHSSARALTSHRRNMTDEMLEAVAKNGGVVMVNFYSAFIDENYHRAYGPLRAEANKRQAELDAKYKDDRAALMRESIKLGQEMAGRIPRPPLKSLIDHIDHVAKVAGVDHVGLGSDFDGITSTPQGIDSAADLPKITAALVERGYSREDLLKILGGNLLRVMRATEKLSQQLAKTK
jgi:membrane dipeptidase